MAETHAALPPPQRHGKPKGGRKRRDEGAKIVVRVTADERERLLVGAGDRPLSDHVRQRLFGVGDGRSEAGDRSRDVLRIVAALHLLARKLDRLVDAGMDEAAVVDLFNEIRAIIESFVGAVPDANDDLTP